MFQFTNDLKTNILHIDRQHKELVELVNRAVALGLRNQNREEMKDCLVFLGEYVVRHFGDEEKLQIESEYPFYLQHKKSHDDFIETFKVMYAGFIKFGPSSKLSYMLSNTVVNWLIKHIKMEDAKFGKHFLNAVVYDLYETKGGIRTLVFPSFPLSALSHFLAHHYGLDIGHANMTAEKLIEGEECPPFGYVSRTLSLKYRRKA
jgi:hemerythrin